MPFYVCNCLYSSSDKSNYNKHILKCTEYIKSIPEIKLKIDEIQQKYENQLQKMKENYEQKLIKNKQEYDEKLEQKQAKYDEKLQKKTDQMNNRISIIKCTHLRSRDEYDSNYIHQELIKECKKRNLEYTDDMSVDELRKIIQKSR
jgi:hypothetical protein